MFERKANNLICCRELLEKYCQCKTPAGVIAVQDAWLEVERKAVKSTSIDYPPSCSSSDSDGEESEGEGIDRKLKGIGGSEVDPSLSEPNNW